MNRQAIFLFILAALVLIVPLAACSQPPAGSPPESQDAQRHPPGMEDLPAYVAPNLPPGHNHLDPYASGDPLRFAFPTPGPQPVSLWRPPLYEPPWALSPHDHFYFARPIAADVVNWPLADYRYGGIFFGPDVVHTGIDIPNPIGTPVIAAAPGKVLWAGYGLFYGNNDPEDPYGLAVSIQHDFGHQGKRLYTIYGHLDRIDVFTGQRVETGDQVGTVGVTGVTTGPHLHFEVRLRTNNFFATRNPELWLAPPQGWGVLAGRLMNTNETLLYRHTVNVRSLETNRRWYVISYGNHSVNSDDHYRENAVLSDLPAGEYQITIEYLQQTFSTEITIHPGAVSYFTFRGIQGFDKTTPPTPPPDAWMLVTDP